MIDLERCSATSPMFCRIVLRRHGQDYGFGIFEGFGQFVSNE